ncbi:MAG: hypothetical protein HYY35_05275 [Deltaproteobacteria bacterium]|nr:hypothetical protein [Deltaproteobacteria bacterium]
MGQNRPSVQKRAKEAARKARQLAKAAQRAERRSRRGERASSAPGEDPDIAGIVPGPQPRLEES